MFGIGGRFKGGLIGLLAFTLLGALWTTALTRVSDRATATSLLTSIGTELLNPLLVANGSGLAEGTYASLEAGARANPNQALSIAFVKPAVFGREIAGKDFAAGSQVIYSRLAAAYYDGGPTNAFSLPSELQQLVNVYTPFTQLPTNLPGVPNLPGTPTGSPLPKLPIPQLPSFAEPIYAAVGISPTTLTKSGHDFEATWSGRFWLASLVLGALMALFGSGWARLSNIAWSVFHSAWHITGLLLLAAFLAARNPAQATHYQGILSQVWGAFFPVYAAATAAGLVGVGIAKFAPMLLKRGAGQAAGAAAGMPFGSAMPGGMPGGMPGMPMNPWQARQGPPGAAPVPPRADYVPPTPQPGYPPAQTPQPGYPPSEGES